MRNHVLHAIYLYQMGRANSDDMLSALLIFAATSVLMTVKSFWKSLTALLLLMLGVMGVVITFSRTLYIVVIVCIALIVFLGNRKESWQGMRRLITAGLAGVAALIPFYYSSRVLRLMLLSYGFRFLSTQHLGTDLSLVNRYVEWKYEWQDILRSPILGYGFGGQFRTFSIIRFAHSWMTFSHSSYLYIIFKTGFIGGALFFGAYVSFLIKGFRLLRSDRLTQRTRIILRASMGYLIGMLIYAYAAPVLDSKTDLIWVGLIWGYLLVLGKHVNPQAGIAASISSSTRQIL
jgi:O-antigen ligase